MGNSMGNKATRRVLLKRTTHPGVYRRGAQYVAVYRRDGRQRKESAATFAEARAIKLARDAEAQEQRRGPLAQLRKAAALGEAESALLECWSSREHRRRAEGLAAGDRAASEKQLTEVLRALGREHQLRSGESYAAELAAAQFPEYVFDSPGAHALPEWAP
jgi:hypothetical protein